MKKFGSLAISATGWLMLLNMAAGATARAAVAADVFDLPPAESVMNRTYRIKNQVSASMGYLPMGSFSKYATGSLSYLWKPDDSHGWEVLNLVGAYEFKEALKTKLISDYGKRPEDFAVLKSMATTNYMFSPIYMKSLLFNSRLVHSQLAFPIGVGAALFSTRTVPVVDGGVVLKFFLASKSTLDVDIRYYAFGSQDETIHSNMLLALAYGWTFGGER